MGHLLLAKRLCSRWNHWLFDQLLTTTLMFLFNGGWITLNWHDGSDVYVWERERMVSLSLCFKTCITNVVWSFTWVGHSKGQHLQIMWKVLEIFRATESTKSDNSFSQQNIWNVFLLRMVPMSFKLATEMCPGGFCEIVSYEWPDSLLPQWTVLCIIYGQNAIWAFKDLLSDQLKTLNDGVYHFTCML